MKLNKTCLTKIFQLIISLIFAQIIL